MSSITIEDGSVVSHAWSGVFAMTLCVMAIIASEFLPVSLLTPIASDLNISEGYAGQSISVSGLFAVMTSLFLTTIIGNHDRKHVMLFFTGLMAISGTIVTFAPNAEIVMFGRALLGICIGGFWGMSASIIMRLVPEETVPKALSVLNAGNAFAMMVAAPLGSYLGGMIGWRGSFFCIVPIVLITFVWQYISLPNMPARRDVSHRPGIKSLIDLLRQRRVQLGMGSTFLLFMGMLSVFTYLRPFLETTLGVNSETLSLLLLALGVSGLVGTFSIGFFLQRTLYGVLISFPFLLSLSVLAMIAVGTSLPLMFVVISIWGFLSTAVPVGWWTWLSKTIPENAEAGGGLMVAVIQLAITLGAASGGVLYDMAGYQTTFTFGAIILGLAAVLAAISGKYNQGV